MSNICHKKWTEPYKGMMKNTIDP